MVSSAIVKDGNAKISSPRALLQCKCTIPATPVTKDKSSTAAAMDNAYYAGPRSSYYDPPRSVIKLRGVVYHATRELTTAADTVGGAWEIRRTAVGRPHTMRVADKPVRPVHTGFGDSPVCRTSGHCWHTVVRHRLVAVAHIGSVFGQRRVGSRLGAVEVHPFEAASYEPGHNLVGLEVAWYLDHCGRLPGVGALLRPCGSSLPLSS